MRVTQTFDGYLWPVPIFKKHYHKPTKKELSRVDVKGIMIQGVVLDTNLDSEGNRVKGVIELLDVGQAAVDFKQEIASSKRQSREEMKCEAERAAKRLRVSATSVKDSVVGATKLTQRRGYDENSSGDDILASVWGQRFEPSGKKQRKGSSRSDSDEDGDSSSSADDSSSDSGKKKKGKNKKKQKKGNKSTRRVPPKTRRDAQRRTRAKTPPPAKEMPGAAGAGGTGGEEAKSDLGGDIATDITDVTPSKKGGTKAKEAKEIEFAEAVVLKSEQIMKSLMDNDSFHTLTIAQVKKNQEQLQVILQGQIQIIQRRFRCGHRHRQRQCSASGVKRNVCP